MTERRPPRLSTLELRLYAVTLFAVVYAIAWRAIAEPAPASASSVADRPPPLAIPAGWQLATTPGPTPPTLAPTPRPSAPRIRVRTRSS